MSCSLYESRPDWKGYVLGELTTLERRDAEAHASSCPACRQELAEVRLTLDSLSALRDEEMPRRIAFVSDKVFEPRWWQMFVSPTFASACVVAVAILVHAFAAAGGGDQAVQAKVDAAVTKAVAEVELRHSEQTRAMLAGFLENQAVFTQPGDEIAIKRMKQMYSQLSGIVRQ